MKFVVSLFLLMFSVQGGEWQNLLDESLSKWELFMGVPHKSVEIPGYEKSKSQDGKKGVPLGLGE